MNRQMRILLSLLLFASCVPCHALLGATTKAGADSIALEWSKVSCSLSNKRGVKRHLLENVCGKALPGRLLAIMGPSGSGKTTLLNSLAGQLVQSRGLYLEGSVLVNGKHISSLETLPRAYVRQEDIFYSQMTVRETLMFVARLRLPKTVPLEEKREVVQSLLGKLSLTKCVDTVVGGQKVRGISGGERKRLSIACELIASPPLIFLDEPTTGLDSFQAQKVVQSLRTLAGEGRTVVCVIHQPSGSVFNMFDDLLLLSEGSLVYYGETKNVPGYFRGVGHPCPAQVNPGEFCLDLISVNHENKQTEAESKDRIRHLAVEFNRRHAITHLPPPPSTGEEPKEGQVRRKPQAGLLEQARLLFARSWREVTRNKAGNIIKVVQQVSTALIYGGIYSLSDSQRSIQDRLGLLSLIAIGNTNLGIAATIRSFPKEKVIVVKDRADRLYGALPYFVSKVLAEVPVSAGLSVLFGALLYPLVGFQNDAKKFSNFLLINIVHSFASSALGLLISAVSPNSDAALALLPPVIVLMIIFNGFNVAEENTPRVLWFLPKLSVVRWGFEGFCVNEFQGLELKCDLGRKEMCAANGEEALSRVSAAFAGATVKKALYAELAIMGACYLQTYNVLRSSGAKYAYMNSPYLEATVHTEKEEGKAYVHGH